MGVGSDRNQGRGRISRRTAISHASKTTIMKVLIAHYAIEEV
jgi:hypothetical protein